jgi:hypothetical protein
MARGNPVLATIMRSQGRVGFWNLQALPCPAYKMFGSGLGIPFESKQTRFFSPYGIKLDFFWYFETKFL